MAPSFFALSLLVIASVVLPKSAIIVDSKESFGSSPVGNVKVTFSDGHTEMWTRLGKCEIPRVSSSGLVGWARFQVRGYRNYPFDDTLRVCWPDGHHQDFKAADGGPYPFIEDWNFTENDTAVVIKSRAAHGAADYTEYDLTTGKTIGHAHGKFGLDLPVWAQPYSD